MAIAPRLISLNLGSQTVGLAEFRVQAHGGLALLDYRLRETPLDPATGQRREAHTALHETAAVLREMMHELRSNRFLRVLLNCHPLNTKSSRKSSRSRRNKMFRSRSTTWFGIIRSSEAGWTSKFK
jgi:hypothetical protein